MDFIISTLIYAVAIFITAYLLPGVKVNGFGTALLAAVLLLIANALIKPILVILTIPITILTLGLFLLVINALIVVLVDKLLKGMEIKNFGWAVLFSIVLSVISAILNWIF